MAYIVEGSALYERFLVSLCDIHVSVNFFFLKAEARFEEEKERLSNTLMQDQQQLLSKYKAREVCALIFSYS